MWEIVVVGRPRGIAPFKHSGIVPKMPGMGPLPGGKWNRGNRTLRHRLVLPPDSFLRHSMFGTYLFKDRQHATVIEVLEALVDDLMWQKGHLLVGKLVILLRMRMLHLMIEDLERRLVGIRENG